MKNQNKTKPNQSKNSVKKKQQTFSEFIFEQKNLSESLLQKDHLLSTQMLVSDSQTQRFKIDFLINSYQQLIEGFKLQRQSLLQNFKNIFNFHQFYYEEIISSAKKIQEVTKSSLKSKLQELSSIIQLRISFLQMKLKQAKKILFSNPFDSNLPMKEKKLIRSPSKKGILIGKKTSCDQDLLDFDQQLKEIYNQKNTEIDLNFIGQQTIHASIENVKKELISQWQQNKQQSISFSYVEASQAQTFIEKSVQQLLFQKNWLPFPKTNTDKDLEFYLDAERKEWLSTYKKYKKQQFTNTLQIDSYETNSSQKDKCRRPYSIKAQNQ